MEDANVVEDYGMRRSLRSCKEVRNLNTRFPEKVSRAINQWQNIERAKVTRPRFSMMEHYDGVVLMLGTILHLSSPM